MKKSSPPIKWMRQRAGDEDGSVSIEFVLVFPLLALWLAASFVWFDAFRAKSLMSKVGYAITDIASRYDGVVTPDQLNGLFDTHKKLLPQRASVDGWMRVSSICYNGSEYRVLWSYLGDDTFAESIANGQVPRLLPLTNADLPEIADILPKMVKDDTIILTDIYSYWKPLVSWAGFEPTALNVRLASRPRLKRVIKADPPLAGYTITSIATFCPTDEDPNGTGGDGSGDGSGGDDDSGLVIGGAGDDDDST